MNHLSSLADFFKILGDTTRLRILNYLGKEEKTVTEVAEGLDMTVAAISYQLKQLKTHRLVKSRKEGKEVYYQLDDHHVFDILKLGKIHNEEVYHG